MKRTQPIQFTLTTGIPAASSNLFDAGLYVQDDWRWRPNITLSAGLRFETQNHIPDHADFAPRLGFAWGIGQGKTQAPKTVLRAGWGIFYDRFTNDLVLQAERQNGAQQQEYIVTDPTFYPNIPPVSAAAVGANRRSDRFTASSRICTRLTRCRQPLPSSARLSKTVNMTVSYVNSRGVHELLTNNINAPLPGTYIVGQPTSGVRPNGILENIYEYESEGIFKQNQLITNINVRAGARLSLNGYYALNYANSDTSGSGSFPSNPYDIGADYGRAGFDIRDRAFFGGTVTLPKGFRLNPFMIINSGTPFNVTVPLDLIGDFHFERPPCARLCHDMPGRSNRERKYSVHAVGNLQHHARAGTTAHSNQQLHGAQPVHFQFAGIEDVRIRDEEGSLPATARLEDLADPADSAAELAAAPGAEDAEAAAAAVALRRRGSGQPALQPHVQRECSQPIQHRE